MDDQILDDDFLTNIEIRNLEDVKEVLKSIGIHNFYEHQNGTIIVEQDDVVRITISYENNIVSVKPKFPKIGNSIQILSTIALLGIFFFIIQVPFPLEWIIAIIGGQVISFLVHLPKTQQLQKRIKRYT